VAILTGNDSHSGYDEVKIWDEYPADLPGRVPQLRMPEFE
jgi:hypothetical protein